VFQVPPVTVPGRASSFRHPPLPLLLRFVKLCSCRSYLYLELESVLRSMSFQI
jgi:hypothetical protein